MSTILHSHKKRIKWLDFIKGIAILFVVFGHATIGSFATKYLSAAFITSFISVDMAIFFVISGYLYKPSNTWDKYKSLLYKKSCGFIIPYLIFTYVFIFSQHLRNFLILFIKNGFRVLYLPTGYVWFLYALFVIFLLVGFMDLIHVNLYIQIVLSLIFYIWSSNFSSVLYGQCGDVNPIPRIGSFMICFYIGILMNKFRIPNLLKKLHLTLILLILFIIIILCQINIYGYQDVNSVNNNLLLTNVFIKLIGILFIFSFAININELTFLFKYFTKYGKATLLIYLVHLPIVYLIQKLFMVVGIRQYFIVTVIIFVVTWLLSIFIYYISNKNKFIEFIFYPRKYFDKLLEKK